MGTDEGDEGHLGAEYDWLKEGLRGHQARVDHDRLEGQAQTRQRIDRIRAKAEAVQAAALAAEKAAAPLMRALGAPSMMDVGLPTRK